MRLLRVQVPDFKVLKKVSISFEPDFYPQVFPLGSLNGGGKSTLLQLIFVLLTCSADEKLHQCIVNMLDGVTIPEGETSRLLARFELHDLDKNFELEFTLGTEINDSEKIEPVPNNIFENLLYKNIKIIKIDNKNIKYLICKISNFDNIQIALNSISSKVLMLAPENQIYLFLNKEEKKSLFYKLAKYRERILEIQHIIPANGFSTYDEYNQKIFKSSLNTLKESKTQNEFDIFINQLGCSICKKIILKKDENSKITEITFKTNEDVELYPEDLSNGELKRLNIFTFIKRYSHLSCLVLIDEIENGFHPDWQRHIVDDLVEWGASNQYILATHSYELCRGVTAAHVKDLYPKLPY